MADTPNTENGERADEWAEALAEQSESDGVQEEASTADSVEGPADTEANGNGAGTAEDQKVQRAEFSDLEDEAIVSGSTDANLDFILDIPVTISMEIGRTNINIRNLLQLNQGSVVELDRLAGEPMDVLVNGTLIAHGEVVVVNEKFGIRLTDVISAAERVKKLK